MRVTLKELRQILAEGKLLGDLEYFARKFELPHTSQLVGRLQAGERVTFDNSQDAAKELDTLYKRGIPDIEPLWAPGETLYGKKDGLERSDYHELGKVKTRLYTLMMQDD